MRSHQPFPWMGMLCLLLCWQTGIVQAQVTANFTSTRPSGCSPLTVQFTNLSTTTPHTTYSWNFGNGNTSNLEDPGVIYVNPGTYTVTLTVTDTLSGSSNTFSRTNYIRVFDDPEPNFSGDALSGCAPHTVNFTDLSTAGDTSIVSWLWDFGDGVTSTQQHPSHVYHTGGSYDVTLVTRDANGCQNSYTAVDYVAISGNLSVDFTANPNIACGSPHTVTFTSNVSPGGSYTYAWDFGDGNTSTAEDPIHTYNTNGSYNVSLTVLDNNGCSVTETKLDHIIIDNPTADFIPLTTSACVGQPVQFINTTTGADGYSWSFGDGGTSSDRDPTHVFLSPGTYSVALVATNSGGCSDSEVKMNLITVHPASTADFTATNNFGCQAPQTVSFQDLSAGATGWFWQFGDGNTSLSRNPSHTYTSPGIYTVSLTITNANGCTSTETKNAYVRIQRPTADFTGGPILTGCIPLRVNFQNLSTATEPFTNYIWDFGDGTTSFDASPSHTYTSQGLYNVSLIVITASGCRDTLVRNGYVAAGLPPNADFMGNPRSVCVDHGVSFTDLSTAGTDWYWNFGDGQGSNAQHPTHVYADTGTFTITLIVENFGCRDTLIRPDYIDVVGPIPDFLMTPATGCNPPLNVQFFDQSGSANQWYWDFGDGGNSTQEDPAHVFNAAGVYTVNLVVTDTVSGCVDSAQQTLTITNPRANFQANPRISCVGSAVTFTNTSTDAASYFWDFGDGMTSTAGSPSHVYNTPGVYDVMLIASDGNCSDTLTRTTYIEVVGSTPEFDVDNITGCAPLAVTFSDLSTPPASGSITNWLWDFGDGGTSAVRNPTHTYNAPGDYDVSLTILDSHGCLNTITKGSFVNPTSPRADFITVDTVACPGAFVRFTSTSTGVGLSHLWDFGDGTTSNTTNPVHLYAPNATYSVSLTVTDINGCTDTEVKFGFVTVGQPTAALGADTTQANCPPLSVNFTDQSSVDVVSWQWNFGDGSVSNLKNPSKVYSTAGVYDVTLMVENAQGCRDTVTLDDYIDVSGPTGAFTFGPVEGCRPLDVTFNGSGQDVASWTWDFGDGMLGFGQNPTHTYTVDTIARPVLVIEDINGCRVAVTTEDSINIRPLPRPRFTVAYTDICLGQVARFTNTSTSERPITSYLWDFGDGTTSTSANPQHTYTTPGTYSVSLRATTVDGCVDSTSMPITITVTALPTASFSTTPNEDCVPAAISFAENSTGSFPLVNWHWDFGDGDTANGQVILPHTYDAAGVYTATLTVTDSAGCTASVSRPVTAHPLPIVEFSANRYGCAPRATRFADETTHSAPIASWFWDFGDGGATSTQRHPTHTFANDGTYTITLTVTDINGCTNTLTKPDYIVLRHPAANFTSNAGVTCPPQAVQFLDASVLDTTSTWFWEFGDGHTSTQQNPSHTYYQEGTFDVSLIVTNMFGCADTIVSPNLVTTYQRPTATFDISDTEACVPQTIAVNSTSAPGAAPLTSYEWDFGNGTTVGGSSASYLYTVPGTYDLSLEITDVNGCRDTATTTVEIHPNPVANFRAADTIGCAITTIAFTDFTTGSNPPVSWRWDFGDGFFSNQQHPNHIYFGDGVYSVGLVVQDINGCRDSLTRPTYIELDHPTANFSTSKTSACPGEVLTFTDLSSGLTNITDWNWDFGDGATSTAQHPTHAFSSPGTYDISLEVTDALGCSHSITRPTYINVFQPPTADFTPSPPASCTPLTVSFADGSTPGDGNILFWNWDFGDGNTSSTPNPIYTYATAGTYTVTLTVTDINGCSHSHSQDVEAWTVPVVDFGASQRVGCAPEAIQFADLTSSPSTLVAWEWSFGDGNTSTLQSPLHTYAADGAYTVKLVVTDLNGCRDSLTRVNYIRLTHPVANFNMSTAAVCPNVPIGVSFTDTSTPDTTLSTWLWDFGDGSTSTAQHPTHSYTTPGTYSIRLIVTNVLGCSDTLVQSNAVDVQAPPTTQFTTSISRGCAPLPVRFTDGSTPGDAAIVAWYWDFGNGTSSNAQHPSHTFQNPGTYEVVLTTTDVNGCQTSDTTTITVDGIPVVDFIADHTRACAPELIQFNDLSTPSPGANIVNWEWDFGDGFSASVTNPTHTYASDGTYTVKLVLTDANGCRDSLTRPDYIRLSHPVADFSFDNAVVCPDLPIGVSFTDETMGDTTLSSWSWQFGDGNSSALQHPAHSYSTPGQYSIELIATDVLGCSDTISRSNIITVRTPPTSGFTASANSGCVPLNVAFTNTSVNGDAPIVAWNWDFGDGNTSLVPSPSHNYPGPGVYTVRLTTRDANGCEHTYTEDVEVFSLPTADFVANQRVGCAPQAITFTDISAGAYPITGWSWDFGDGNVSNLQHPTHTYAADGTYELSLTVTDQNGCQASMVKPMYIRLSHPVAEFTMDRDRGCPGLEVNFTDESIADTTLTHWAWDFGDGSTSTQQNPSHTYTTPGQYTVSLRVTNLLGCDDLVVKTDTIEVYTPPTTTFVPSTTRGCLPLTVGFTDHSFGNSGGIVSWSWDFGHGQTSLASNPPAQTYTNPGTYWVRLTTTDVFGCSSVDSVQITVDERPSANFLASQSLSCAPVLVSFTDLSTGPATIDSWLWDFGDGNTSTLQNPTHTYLANGTYTVRLIVVDENGCRDTLTRANHLRLNPPTADFSVDNTRGCTGLPVSFTDQSLSDTTLVAWQWDFGDGTTATGSTVSHVYDHPGLYTVRLIVRNVVNCVDTVVRSNLIEVFTSPSTAFTPSVTEGCAPLDVQFIDNSTGNSAGINAWNWDFGNGNTSTSSNPPVQTFTTGTYWVTLTTTDLNGCSSTDSVLITANQPPRADFLANQTLSCAPVAVTFSDLSSGTAPATNWWWDFGDGNTSTQRNPTHTYTTNGTYTVQLIMEDANGCRDTVTKVNYLRLNPPAANFTADNTEGCPGLTVNFSDLSVSDTTLVSWLWDFGDGNTGMGQNVSHTYANPGQYTVRLIVRNVVNCVDTLVRSNYIEVFTDPTTAFTPSATQGCVPFTAQFTDNSVGNSAGIVQRLWDFGNGQTSTSANPPMQTYSLAGTYWVTLTTTDANGCQSSDSVRIEASDPPVADFVANQTLSCAPVPISFTDLSTGPVPIRSWQWDFGDGTTSTQRNPVHTYRQNGTYTVTLTVIDDNGCTATLTRTHYLRLNPPVADFSVDNGRGCTGLPVNFSDLSTSDTTIVDWQWDFGDGTTGSGPNPSHVYNAPGTYTVQLVVRNLVNCLDTIRKVDAIEVFFSPEPHFTVSDTIGCVPLTISLENQALGVSAPISSHSWDLGDGNGSTLDDLLYTYTTPGVYPVSLLVTDENGCTSSRTQNIHVQPLPTANFFTNTRVGCAPIDVRFTNTSTGSNAIVAWEWDFGDGGTSTERTPTHTYTRSGTFTVSLIVFDQYGCSDTLVRPNYIKLSRPEVDFTLSRDRGCPGFMVQFRNLSVPDTTMASWEWDFGDGTTSNALHAIHVYDSPGLYTVSLTGTNVLGCASTETKVDTIEVFMPPTTQIDPSVTQGCTPVTVDFTDASIGNSAAVVGWNWNLGEGTTSSQQNPIHEYTVPGTYTVRLIATDANGCIDTAFQVIEALSLPTAEFGANPRIGCAPQAVDFRDLSVGEYTATAWEWDFGDGTTSSQQTPSHTYLTDGTYTVRLVMFDENGCSDTLTKVNYIQLSHPVAAFTLSDDVVCPWESIQFTDTSIPDTTLVSWQWDFGDGHTSNARHPVHFYENPGRYTVSLTITNLLGCGDTETKVDTIEVMTRPDALFTPSSLQSCPPFTVGFTNNSVPNTSPIASYFWDFDNGATAMIPNPSTTFTDAGTHTVMLVVTDQAGCADTATVEIEGLEYPRANFTATDSLGCAPFTTTFVDRSTGDFDIVSRLWDFGDGFTSTEQFPSHTYAADGEYDVSLTVTDENGCTNTITKPRYIRLRHPQADFTMGVSQICPGTVVSFIDASTPDTTISSWLWDFGDGFTSTDPAPIHMYTTQGSYTVSLTVTNVLGCSDTEIKVDTIEVLEAPVAGFNLSAAAGCAPLDVTFTDVSTSATSTVVAWNWDFGDGVASTDQHPQHTYTQPGTYTVILETRDARGCTNAITRTVRVWELPEVGFRGIDSLGCAAQTVQFEDLTTSPFSINGWQWDFGDGGTSLARNPIYTYSADGTYDVRLVVTDRNGCRDTLTRRRYIRLSHPVADFTVDTTEGCPGLSVQFLDRSVGDTTLVGWEWDFGDGSTSTVQHPRHTYDQPGVYTVRLRVTNLFGCTATEIKVDTIEVFTPPGTQFVPSTLQGCVPLNVTFTNSTIRNSAPITAWRWEFGTGDTSIFPNATYTFTQPGTYTVRLTALDGYGCSESYEQQIEVFPLPIANFTPSDSLGCSPATINFLDQSGGNAVLNSWQWTFGDGGTSSLQFPAHTYHADGVYDVSLTVQDANGCQNSLAKPRLIRLSHPQARFDLDNTLDCPGMSVQFTDTSVPDTTLANWLWDFGDGTTSNMQHPVHVYTDPGVYTVSLTVTNVLGCSDTEVQTNVVRVLSGPQTAFTVSDSAGCMPFEPSFMDLSVGTSAPIVSWQWDFGDGSSSTAQNPTHTYPIPADYQVQLITTDNNGCQDSATHQISSLTLPDANFMSVDTVGCAPFTAEFTDLSTGDYHIAGWLWDFGDGQTSMEQHPTHLYTRDGSFTVSLIIYDEYGCTDTLVRPNYVNLTNPVADLAVLEPTGCVGEAFAFSDISRPDTTLVSWEWDFGDGTGSIAQHPSHVYAQAGTYDVSMVIRNAIGCTDTVTYPNLIRVWESPVAFIQASDTSACVPQLATFRDSSESLYSVVDWTWTLDGRLEDQSQGMSVFFDSIGVYDIGLTVTDIHGCQDSASLQVGIHPIPVANFTVDDSMTCAVANLQFTDQSEHPPTQWNWSFGDGTTSSSQNPIHTYAEDGIYDVRLEIMDQFGCGDTLVKRQYIQLDHPVGDFYVSYLPGCAPLEATFLAEGTGQAPVVDYFWLFGDGHTGTGDSIRHTYQVSGEFTVSLVITDSLGCQDTITKPDVVDALHDVPPGPMDIHYVSVEGDSRVRIEFAPFRGVDFERYNIYRESKDVPGTWELIDSTFSLQDTVHIDYDVNTLDHAYCYKVTAENSCGTESDLRTTDQHCTIEVTATPVDDRIILRWNPYMGWDKVELYEVYRVKNYNQVDVDFLGIVPGSVEEFSDETTECFEDYTYRVRAIGSREIEASWSDTTAASNRRGFTADANEMILATVENDRDVLVEWDEFDEMGDVTLVYLERRSGNDPWTTIGTHPPDTFKYRDSNVDVDRRSYAYRVSAQDSCGYINPPSRIATSVLLDVEQTGSSNSLSWSAYEDWRFGVAAYEIEVFHDDLGLWTMVDRVPGNQTDYVDTQTQLDQPEYCYRIWAMENGHNQKKSLSNQVCLPVWPNVYIPDAFTPNNDGINDEFKVGGMFVTTFNLQIYSRWGLMLFETFDMNAGWDGTYKGKNMPEGVYVYIVRGVGYNDTPYEYKGTITMFR